MIRRNSQISNHFLSGASLTLFRNETYTDRMTAGRVWLALLLVALVIAWPGRLLAQAIQKSLYVTIVTDAGAPVPDLGPADFIVREDNIAREVLRVEPATEPMQIALLVDTSHAARDNIAHMRTALPAFVSALTAGTVRNEVALIAFGERPTILTEYTNDRAALQKGINRIWAQEGSGAYLLDAVFETCQGIKKRESRRPVIVAIAVEGDEYSFHQYDQVLETLGASGAPFYPIMLGQPSSSTSDESRSRQIVLGRGPASSGGRLDQLLSSMALADTLKRLANQLTHQYKVTYARPQSLIPPEKVTVAAAAPGRTARRTLVKDQQGRH